MPDLNDYYAFKSTTTGSGSSGSGGSNSSNGGSGGCLPWILITLAIFGLLTKCAS